MCLKLFGVLTFLFSFLFSVSAVIEYLEAKVLRGWRELVDDQLQ